MKLFKVLVVILFVAGAYWGGLHVHRYLLPSYLTLVVFAGLLLGMWRPE